MSAFSLTELLVVITIIIVLSSVLGPTIGKALRGSNLVQGSDLVGDVLAIAHQQAVTKQQTVEVRFYCYTNSDTPGDNGQCHGFQTFLISDSGNATPLTKPQKLPQTVVISTNTTWSTLFTLTKNSSAATNISSINLTSLPNIGTNYTFYAFQYQRSGLTSLVGSSPSTPWTWSLSVVNLQDVLLHPTTFPINYATLVIDPYNGSLRVYRPTL